MGTVIPGLVCVVYMFFFFFNQVQEVIFYPSFVQKILTHHSGGDGGAGDSDGDDDFQDGTPQTLMSSLRSGLAGLHAFLTLVHVLLQSAFILVLKPCS